MVYLVFHYPLGVLFIFHWRYYFGIMPCKVVLVDSHGIPRDPTQSEHKLVMIAATKLQPSRVQHSTASPSGIMFVFISHNPTFTVQLAPISFVATMGITFDLFSLATKMLQFNDCLLPTNGFDMYFRRLAYLEISGSIIVFNSLRHFVTCYTLPHIWMPRYPPQAFLLLNLIINIKICNLRCWQNDLINVHECKNICRIDELPLSSRTIDKWTRTAHI